MYKEKSDTKLYAFLLFLIWPALSVWFAFKYYNTSWAKNIIWLFVVFYGYTMVISNTGIDANRYRDKFIESSKHTTSNDEEIKVYKEGEGESVDFIQPILNKIISKITNNHKILFAVYGLIFGFFYSRSIWILLERINHPITFISVILLLVFILINPFWNINGFRFNTALQIFIYGVLLYFVEGKKKGIWFILITFTVHFSFIIAITIFLMYLLIGNRITIYFYFFIASLFIGELQLDGVRDKMSFLPSVFLERTEGYVNEEYKDSIVNKRKEINWYASMYSKILHYSIYFLLIGLYIRNRSSIKKHRELYNFLGLIFLFYGISNIISSIPSAGRFLTLAASMAIGLIILIAKNLNDIWLNRMFRITIPFLFLFIIVIIRIGFDTIGITTVFGNPFIAIFMENDKALIELIK